jgi:O-succinylbenzoic acid--CoA ligase
VAGQLRQAGVTFGLCDEAHEELWRAAADMAGASREIPYAVLREGTVEGSAALPGSTADSEGARLHSLHDEGRVPAPPVRVPLARVQSLVFTSGTTGTPKAARITYGNHLYSALACALRLGVLPGDRWYTALPLFHVGGMGVLMRSVIYGTTAVVDSAFDPERANRALDEGAALASVVANMLARMFAARGDAPYPARLRCILLGGGPAPPPLLEEALARGVPVCPSYGLTETNSQVATLAPSEARRKFGSAGRPTPFSEIRIVSADGQALPAGMEGEIAVCGPSVVAGYYGDPEATGRAFRDGWLLTGDIGMLDEDGYLFVRDRRSDLIVSGGENVYPAEIESVLLAHPAVLEAGVVGVADERYGKVPLAVLRLAPGTAATEEEIRAFCRERLAGYKVPRHVRFAPELPRNAAGKLLRRELAAWL